MWLSAARLSETHVAFAGRWGAPVETAIAFACSYVHGVETAIAFAGEKWAFLVRFLVAVVLLVSTVAVQGCAVVAVVSCWPVSVVAEVSLVSKSPRHSVPCAKKLALLGLLGGGSAKKFAQRTKNAPKMAFYGLPGELFRGNTGGDPLPGELFRG